MSDTTQGKLDLGDPELEELVEAIVRGQLRALEQPSAWDLLARIEEHVGWAGRWSAEAVLTRIAQDTSLICLYSTKAQTAQHKQRLLALLEQAIPGIIQFMRWGFSVGFHAAQSYVELLDELETTEKALRECEQFLRVTARPDKPGRVRQPSSC